MATGDVVAWLNADEYYLPGTFQKVIDAFNRHPDKHIVYGETVFANADKQFLRTKREHRFDYNILLYYGCYIPSVATFFRRSIMIDGNFLDTDYDVTMDFEYFVRLSKQGYHFSFLPVPLGVFRWHDANVSTRLLDQKRKERLRVQWKYGHVITRNRSIQTWLFDIAALIFHAKRVLLKTHRFIFAHSSFSEPESWPTPSSSNRHDI